MRAMRRRGFSLVELTIAVAILTIVVGMIYAIMENSASAYARDSARQTLQDNARRVLDDLSAELRDSDRDNLLIPASPNNVSVRFRKAGRYNPATGQTEAFLGGVALWSDFIEYRYEPSPVDVNTNGIADEGRIVRVGPDVQGVVRTSILCDYVPLSGFTLVRTGDRVAASLRLLTLDAQRRALELTVQTSIALRNHP